MTRKERLMTIFRGETPDRPAVKLWGAGNDANLMHPDYGVVRDAALRLTDLFYNGGDSFNIYCGQHSEKLIEVREEPTDSPEWVDDVVTFHTPEGDLERIHTRSTVKKPGYEKEHLLKEPGDIKKLLSLPYEPYELNIDNFLEKEREAGDSGITMFGLDHPMYALERLIGSENFAFWSLECRGLLADAIEVFRKRIFTYAESVIAAGLKPVFGWVGPELCIPPLMSPFDFDEFVGAVDKPLIDMIHNCEGYVWVHSHGNMKGMITRFMEMDIDVLNPIEPPPMGDITLEEAFQLVGDRMGLEGSIESHDIMVAPKEELIEKIHTSLTVGNGKKFILCPSSGYMEVNIPPKEYIDNLLAYVEEGVRFADSLK